MHLTDRSERRDHASEDKFTLVVKCWRAATRGGMCSSTNDVRRPQGTWRNTESWWQERRPSTQSLLDTSALLPQRCREMYLHCKRLLAAGVDGQIGGPCWRRSKVEPAASFPLRSVVSCRSFYTLHAEQGESVFKYLLDIQNGTEYFAATLEDERLRVMGNISMKYHIFC